MFFLDNIQVYIIFYTYWLQAISFFMTRMLWSNSHAQLVAIYYSN